MYSVCTPINRWWIWVIAYHIERKVDTIVLKIRKKAAAISKSILMIMLLNVNVSRRLSPLDVANFYEQEFRTA
jgi:hypothetical protein